MPLNENKEKITHHVRIIAKNNKLNEVRDALEVCAKEARNEPGCEYYEIIQNIANPLLITLVEKYSNYDAFKQHLKSPEIRNFIDHIQSQLVDEVSDSLHVTFIDSLGSRSQINVEDLTFRNEIKK